MHKLTPFLTIENLPVADKLEQSGLNLPSFPLISRKEVKFVSDTIKSFFHI